MAFVSNLLLIYRNVGSIHVICGRRVFERDSEINQLFFLMQLPLAYRFLKDFGVATEPPERPRDLKGYTGVALEAKGRSRGGCAKPWEPRGRPKCVQEEPTGSQGIAKAGPEDAL